MRIIVVLTLLWQVAVAHAGPLDDCERARDIERRIQRCTDRIRQYPSDATAFFNRGTAYLFKGDLDGAIADYSSVAQIDPAYGAAYYHRGIAYASRDQDDQAIADFSKAIEINPKHAGAVDARARLYLKTGKLTLALGDAERAVGLDPFDETFLDTRAHVYEALGRTQDAIADYRRVASGNRSMSSAIDGLKRLGVSSSALGASADTVSPAESGADAHQYSAQLRSSREEIECERARQADPTGYYASYPCWAREGFARRRR